MLDGVLDYEADDYNEKSSIWTIKYGVTLDMRHKIRKEINIRHYAFDITQNVFLKHMSDHQNFPALVYYAVDSHTDYCHSQGHSSPIEFIHVPR